jgi:hypothetical protein
MKQKFPWEANPARKYFEILLVTFWGYSLGMHQTYRSKSFGVEERNYLKEEVKKLPSCPLRLFLRSIIDLLGPPPVSFKITTFKIKADKDKLIYTHEIMAMPEVFFRISGLALLNTKSVEIFSNLKRSLILGGFKEEHIARFLAQFWNASMRNGYSSNSRMALMNIIESKPELASSFKPLLDEALSDKTPGEKMALYDIKLEPHQERALNSQILQNGKLALYQSSKYFGDGKRKSEQTKNLKEYLSIYPDLVDLTQNGNPEESSGNLFGNLNIGDGYE